MHGRLSQRRASRFLIHPGRLLFGVDAGLKSVAVPVCSSR